MNPDYAAYYHTHARLDPRLPPPLYAPGQSWQVWAPLPGKTNASPLNKGPVPGFLGNPLPNHSGYSELLTPRTPSRNDKTRGFSLEEEQASFYIYLKIVFYSINYFLFKNCVF